MYYITYTYTCNYIVRTEFKNTKKELDRVISILNKQEANIIAFGKVKEGVEFVISASNNQKVIFNKEGIC